MSFAKSSHALVFRADGSVAVFAVTDKLTAAMQIAERIYSLAQEHNNSALMIGACVLWQPRYTIRAISSPRDKTRYAVFRSGAREAYSLRSKRTSRLRSMSVLRGPIGVAFRRDRLLQNEHGGSDLAGEGAE